MCKLRSKPKMRRKQGASRGENRASGTCLFELAASHRLLSRRARVLLSSRRLALTSVKMTASASCASRSVDERVSHISRACGARLFDALAAAAYNSLLQLAFDFDLVFTRCKCSFVFGVVNWYILLSVIADSRLLFAQTCVYLY